MLTEDQIIERERAASVRCVEAIYWRLKDIFRQKPGLNSEIALEACHAIKFLILNQLTENPEDYKKGIKHAGWSI